MICALTVQVSGALGYVWYSITCALALFMAAAVPPPPSRKVPDGHVAVAVAFAGPLGPVITGVPATIWLPGNPLEPVGPGGPVGPVVPAPVGPRAPLGPVGPVAPVGP